MAYPTTFDVETPEKMANWRPLVQWLLAIPHLAIVNALESVSGIVAVISWFAILFTGRLPPGLAELQMLYLRYSIRVAVYAGFLDDRYTPFEFSGQPAEPGGTAISVGFEPTYEDRNKLTVGLRFLWIIPILLYTIVMSIAAFVVWIIAVFAVLFTGAWPSGMRSFVVKVTRLNLRVNAYATLLTDQYPPFELPSD
jgi:hypothetical protein